MNFILHINRKIILLLLVCLLLLFTIFIIGKQISLKDLNLNTNLEELSKIDISEPKFSINNDTKKINITAKKGNFLNKDQILLKENVQFKSNDFSIETDNVLFDRNNQTAKSKAKSLFKSKNTTIESDGFDIHDKGNKIIFYGNSTVVLK